jgi:hypothetical protein
MKWYEGKRFAGTVLVKSLKVGVVEPDGTQWEVDLPLGTEMVNLNSEQMEKLSEVKVIEERGLDPRFDLRRHSPDGFEWGYCGSGPAQLALALLCDATGNDELAKDLYQRYKFKFVAGWVGDTFLTSDVEIMRWVCKQTLSRDRLAAE